MRQICAAAVLVAIVALTPAGPARADLVIEGRAAQALHCSAMLFMVSSVMFDEGFISRNLRDDAQRGALVMLDAVPGTDKQRVQAMAQRFDRIMESRTPPDLLDEYNKSARWCQRAFLR